MLANPSLAGAVKFKRRCCIGHRISRSPHGLPGLQRANKYCPKVQSVYKLKYDFAASSPAMPATRDILIREEIFVQWGWAKYNLITREE